MISNPAGRLAGCETQEIIKKGLKLFGLKLLFYDGRFFFSLSFRLFIALKAILYPCRLL